MTTLTINETKKVNSINEIKIDIETTTMGNWSILAYNEDDSIYIQKFADTYFDALIISEKLFNKFSNNIN